MTTEFQAPEGVDGWVTMWPSVGGGRRAIYSPGATKPSYGPELDARLTVYPVYAAPQPSPAEGALTDEQIDAMLSDIDDIARNVDFYEFGLPIADEPRAAMREAVRAAIASNVQPKGTAAELTDVQIADAATGIKPYPVELAQVPAAQTVAFARAVIAADRALQAPAPAPEFDVRRIMLDVVPGEDGMGEEVYAKSVADVEAVLTRMGERIEELESRAQGAHQ